MTVMPPADPPAPPADPPTPPVEDPDKAELARLRKAETDRAEKERADEKAELARLKAYEAEQTAKAAGALKAPVKKADKPAAPADPPPAAKRRRFSWFPDEPNAA